MPKNFDTMPIDTTGMHWKERLPLLLKADFTPDELHEICVDAALDRLSSGQLRTMVILLAQPKAD